MITILNDRKKIESLCNRKDKKEFVFFCKGNEVFLQLKSSAVLNKENTSFTLNIRTGETDLNSYNGITEIFCTSSMYVVRAICELKNDKVDIKKWIIEKAHANTSDLILSWKILPKLKSEDITELQDKMREMIEYLTAFDGGQKEIRFEEKVIIALELLKEFIKDED